MSVLVIVFKSYPFFIEIFYLVLRVMYFEYKYFIKIMIYKDFLTVKRLFILLTV